MHNLHHQLSLLETSGLIRPAQLEPVLEYLFRHALVRDAAYDSLLRADRKRLHQTVGRTLAEAYPDRDGEMVGVVAEHYLLGEAWEQAAEYLMYAGNAAVSRYSDIEARGFFEKAVTALSHLPDSPDTLRQRADSLQKLVNASIMAEMAEVSIARLEKAEAAARALVAITNLPEDKYLLAQTLYQQGHLHFGQPDRALVLFDQVIEIANELGDETLAIYPSNIIGQYMTISGDLEIAVRLCQRARDGFRAAGNTVEIIACRGNLGYAMAGMGRLAEGIAEAEAALQAAIDHDNLTGQAVAYMLLANSYDIAGQLERAILTMDEAVRCARASENPHYERASLGSGLLPKLQLGQIAAAQADLQRIAELNAMLGDELLGSDLLLAFQGWLAFSLKDYDTALHHAEAAIQVAQSMGMLYGLGWAHYVAAQALFAIGAHRWDEAEQHLAMSLQVHEGRSGHMDAGRTHALWARLCRERGDLPCADQHFEAARTIFAAAGASEELARLEAAKST